MTVIDWTEDKVNMLRTLCEQGLTLKQITERMTEYAGEPVTWNVTINAIRRFGLKTKRMYGPRGVTQEMRDFLYVNRDKTVRDATELFNAKFGTDFDKMRVYRLMLEARADPNMTLTSSFFIEEWDKLQHKLAPEGQERRKHWLWRWRRFDDSRTATGCVYRGKRTDIT